MPEEQPPKWLSIQVGERQEGAHFYPLKGDRPLRFAPEVFSQSDFVQNRVLVQEVLNACAVKKTDRVLDLCCGVGNFSLPLSQKAKVVEGVEGSRRAVELASKNALRWGRATSCLSRVTSLVPCMVSPARASASMLWSSILLVWESVCLSSRLIQLCSPFGLCFV